MRKVDRNKFVLKEIEIKDNTKGNEVITVPDHIYTLTIPELLAVRKAIEPFRLRTELLGDVRTGIKIESLNICWFYKVENAVLMQVIDIQDDIGYLHFALPGVLQFTEKRFAISNDWKIAGDDDKTTAIVEFDIGVPSYPGMEVFASLQELKKSSSIYKGLSDRDKNKITKDTNIQKLNNGVLVKSFGNKTLEFIQHLYLGDIRKGKSSGIHHIYAVLIGHAKIVSITKEPDKHGVWEAKINKRDKRSDRDPRIKPWKEKDERTTFFPSNWTQLTLMTELKHAFDTKRDPQTKKFSIEWTSNTKCGIPVLILTDLEGNIITIYPKLD